LAITKPNHETGRSPTRSAYRRFGKTNSRKEAEPNRKPVNGKKGEKATQALRLDQGKTRSGQELDQQLIITQQKMSQPLERCIQTHTHPRLNASSLLEVLSRFFRFFSVVMLGEAANISLSKAFGHALMQY